MTQEGEPRRTTATGVWAIVFDQDASNDILINFDTEDFPDDQGVGGEFLFMSCCTIQFKQEYVLGTRVPDDPSK